MPELMPVILLISRIGPEYIGRQILTGNCLPTKFVILVDYSGKCLPWLFRFWVNDVSMAMFDICWKTAL